MIITITCTAMATSIMYCTITPTHHSMPFTSTLGHHTLTLDQFIYYNYFLHLSRFSLSQVSHVLNVAYGVGNLFPDQLTYKTVNILDVPDTPITSYLADCSSFIDLARAKVQSTQLSLSISILISLARPQGLSLSLFGCLLLCTSSTILLSASSAFSFHVVSIFYLQFVFLPCFNPQSRYCVSLALSHSLSRSLTLFA